MSNFASENQEQSKGNGSKRSFAKTVTPVNVRFLMQHNDQSNEPLMINGKPVGMVSIVGQVRNISQGNMSKSYLVEDDTGRIEAIHYIEESDLVDAIHVNTFVKIIGLLKYGGERLMVTVYKLISVRNMHEVNAHKLEIAVLPLRIAKVQSMAAMLAQAQATFNGLNFCNFGFSQMPMSLPNRQWNENISNGGQMNCSRAGDMFSSNNLQQGVQFKPPGCSMPVRDIISNKKNYSQPHGNNGQGLNVGPHTGNTAFNNSKVSANNNSTTRFPASNPMMMMMMSSQVQQMAPDARKILASIKSCPMEVGLSVRELVRNYRSYLSEQKIKDILNYLISEGHIYSTVDDFHFRSTD